MAANQPIFVRSQLSEAQEFAWQSLEDSRTGKIGIFLINPMEWSIIDRIAGKPLGSYQKNPIETYRLMQINSGVGLLDQWIPENPLSMGSGGYESDSDLHQGVTTGGEKIILDGMEIREPEDAVAHLEKFVFPALQKVIQDFDEDKRVAEILANEKTIQETLGPEMLKTGYGFVYFPAFRYTVYGYANYFMAVALYPEVIEKDFRLQGNYCTLNNRAAARAFREGNLPPLNRLDHDMADSRGMLVNMKVLDKIWLPHFARCIKPAVQTNMKLIWHSDGNLMALYPRLLEAGVKGFQGFQYECGMDYQNICRMKTIDGTEPYIIAGVSVTRTLPFGTPDDIRKEMQFLVENGPANGMSLAGTSSITPGVPWANMQTLIEGFHYYRKHGRKR